MNFQANQTRNGVNIDNNTSFVEKISQFEFIFEKVTPRGQGSLPLN